MSMEILKEADFFLDSFLAGVWMLVIYDGLRIVRRMIPHGVIAIAVEDFFYWLFSGICIFRMMLIENDGNIRSFSIIAIFTGMLFYNLTISEILLKYIVNVLKKIRKIFKRLWKILKKISDRGQKHENKKV